MSPPLPHFTLLSDSQLELPTMEGRHGEPSKVKEEPRKGLAGEEERDEEEEGLVSRKLGGEEEKKRRLSSPAPGSATAVGRKVGSVGGGSGVGSGSQAFCQAEKCAADLTDAKRYHRRHKVCETHSKAAIVIVAGLRQRFCQQCSRFHELTEFDDSKRSCRRRLAGHNERRRKSSSETQGDASSSCGQADQSGRTQIALPGTPTYKHFQIR